MARHTCFLPRAQRKPRGQAPRGPVFLGTAPRLMAEAGGRGRIPPQPSFSPRTETPASPKNSQETAQRKALVARRARECHSGVRRFSPQNTWLVRSICQGLCFEKGLRRPGWLWDSDTWPRRRWVWGCEGGCPPPRNRLPSGRHALVPLSTEAASFSPSLGVPRDVWSSAVPRLRT